MYNQSCLQFHKNLQRSNNEMKDEVSKKHEKTKGS